MRYQKVNCTKKAITLLKIPSFLHPSLCLTPTSYESDWLILLPKFWPIIDEAESHSADCSSINVPTKGAGQANGPGYGSIVNAILTMYILVKIASYKTVCPTD